MGIAKAAPEAALAAVVADVLAEPSNWDTTLVGLQALLVILFDGPKQSSRRAGADSEVLSALRPPYGIAIPTHLHRQMLASV